MSYDLFINSYVVGDAELDWVEQEHPDWIDRYYSTIIETFDCTLYSKFALAVGLYRRGNLDAINKLWLDYSYLFYVDGVRNEDYPIKQIWQLLDWAEINPVEVVLSNIVK